jgi:CTP:molybdopterin cytidylyltransferase MocA
VTSVVRRLPDAITLGPSRKNSSPVLSQPTGEAARSIIASSYDGSYGVPSLFGKKYFERLAALEGAVGAKQLIQSFIADVQLVAFPQGEINIDTPDDLSRLN